MRRYFDVALTVLFAFACDFVQAESLPYEAQIVVPGAPVRSGPGDQFYATDTLPEGEVVEVYRHRQNGWCAVRPTTGSYSWVFGPHLRVLDDSLAEIDKPDVASRIGSRLSRHRNAVQVRLKKGEVVEVLEIADEGGQTWYKIAPPAGEFRWIHSSCIRPVDGSPKSTPMMPVIEPKSTPDAGQSPPIVTVAAEEPTNEGQGNSSVPAQSATRDEWRAAPIAPPLASVTPSSPPAVTQTPDVAAMPSIGGSSPAVATTITTATTTASPSRVAAPTNTAASNVIPVEGDVSRKLTDIELRLSRMVSDSPSTWQIESLQQQTEQLLSESQTVAERDAVKVTLEKFDRFAAIHRRHLQIAGGAGQRQSPSAITPIPVAAGAGAGQLDAVGVLRPVVSKRPGAPQFALVDERGRVVSFVSSTPDLNLQPYVGQRVGIVGNRGFIPEFHRAHVTASRVTPLEQPLVR